MFKLDQSRTYFWPVEVKIPTDGGTFVTETFDAEFKRIKHAELVDLQAQVLDGKITDGGMVRTIMAGWRGVTNQGVDVPFGPTSLDQLLTIPGVAGAIVLAFVDSCSGGQKRKN